MSLNDNGRVWPGGFQKGPQTCSEYCYEVCPTWRLLSTCLAGVPEVIHIFQWNHHNNQHELLMDKGPFFNGRAMTPIAI